MRTPGAAEPDAADRFFRGGAANCIDPDGAILAIVGGITRNERTGRLECVIDGAELVVP